MAAWVTPKTNWYGATSNGVYTGDYFTAVDFNRIKNNLVYLRDYAVTTLEYPVFQINDLGTDRGYSDFFYAHEMNALEENLDIINNHTLLLDYGTAPVYYANGPAMTFEELNRLEGAILDLYERFTSTTSRALRMFIWNFGIGVEL